MPNDLENLERLHQEEESIRTSSLVAIGGDDRLRDHLGAIHDAMDHLTVLLQVDSVAGSDRHTLQLLVIRLFNTGASALRVGLSGYYQTAFQVLRDSLELANLADLFAAIPSKISKWKDADDKTLKRDFGPAAVRKALASLPQHAGQDRNRIYALFSSHATHATYKGFRLVAPGNSPKLGPFFDASLLRALLEDLGRHLAHATLALSIAFEDDLTVATLQAKATYVEGLGKYHGKYIKR